MVKDINSSGSSSPRDLTAVGNTFYFKADGINGEELWKSDGSSSGTVMFKDIPESNGGSSFPSYLTAVGNTLFFVSDDVTNGLELWTNRLVYTEVSYS